MFRNALRIARGFTFPVIISRRAVNGVCSSSLGAFVVINEEGWIVTAGHILEQWHKLNEQTTQAKESKKQYDDIYNDKSLTQPEKKKAFRQIQKLGKEHTDRCSALWGNFIGNPKLVEYGFLKGVDLGVGKLEPFDPKWVNNYPTFKDPAKDFDPGVMLCKLGYPFHVISPSFDDSKDTFLLPPGALPAPMFPIEGIFTRVAYIQLDGVPPPPYPLMWVETSSPGLKGQSGGPTLDEHGSIWAIQCQTSSYGLGFEPKIKDQYQHVGLGVHPETLFNFFNEHKITYNISAY